MARASGTGAVVLKKWIAKLTRVHSTEKSFDEVFFLFSFH
jgi:hypothetical protein